MNLKQLPLRLASVEAQRIADALLRVDRLIPEVIEPAGLTLTLYGSAAVSLYFADEFEEDPAFTDDIDVDGQGMSALLTAALSKHSGDLTFQPTPIGMWLIHPDWREELVEVSALVGVERLRVLLLSPRDLILTKLERYSARDDEDCVRLLRRYIDSPALLPDALEVALESGAGFSDSRRSELRRTVAWLCEEFEPP